MKDAQLSEILLLLDPKSGKRLWLGSPTPLGCLRGVSPEQAMWKPHPDRHSIWELTLHIAYWKYAVRRKLEGSPARGFPRSPANWPRVPNIPNAGSWKADRALLRFEHEQLVVATQGFDAKRLGRRVPGSGAYRYLDILYGIIMHDFYHVAQIQLLKRLFRSSRS
jgi:hypothetical protein